MFRQFSQVTSLSSSPWVFSLKSFIGAMLALFIAFSLDLDRPYWALISAYIVSQPLAGAVRSKAVYRICGTFLGATASIAFIPNFVNEPLLLSLALALWISGCLYISVLDRTPRSYIFLLAGYTVGIIGYPSVNAPNDIFNVAVSRFEEITIGIICATVMHSIFFPLSVTSVFKQRLDAWWQNVKRLMQGMLANDSSKALITEWENLAAEITELYILSTHLAFDTTTLHNTSVLLALDKRMSTLLSILYVIADRLRAIHTLQSLPSALLTLQQIELLLTTDSSQAENPALQNIDEAIKHFTPEIQASSTWLDILKTSLAVNLNRLIQLSKECGELRSSLFTVGKTLYKKNRPLHKDHEIAFLSALATFVTLMSICIFWIATAWPSGSIAALLGAIASCFFASQLNPVLFILRFIYVLLLNVPIAAFYLFVVFPRVDGFFMLALVFAPYYLMAGFLMAMPRWFGAGLASILSITNLILIQTHYNADFAAFLNTTIALLIGMGTAALFNYLFRSLGVDWNIKRLLLGIWQDLTLIASQDKSANDASYTLRTVDRLGLLKPLLEHSPHYEAIVLQGIQNLNIGLDMIELQDTIQELSINARKLIRQLLDELTQYFYRRSLDDPQDLSTELLLVIDAALTEVTALPETSARQHALLGLCGLRRNLFAEAVPYVAYS